MMIMKDLLRFWFRERDLLLKTILVLICVITNCRLNYNLVQLELKIVLKIEFLKFEQIRKLYDWLMVSVRS